MSGTFPERDWKYLRSVHEELLSSLFGRINRKAIEILQVELSEREKYRDLYHHILDADKIVAQCFDDWRRSNIRLKLIALYHHGLLTEEHISHLSEETKDFIKRLQIQQL